MGYHGDFRPTGRRTLTLARAASNIQRYVVALAEGGAGGPSAKRLGPSLYVGAWAVLYQARDAGWWVRRSHDRHWQLTEYIATIEPLEWI